MYVYVLGDPEADSGARENRNGESQGLFRLPLTFLRPFRLSLAPLYAPGTPRMRISKSRKNPELAF